MKNNKSSVLIIALVLVLAVGIVFVFRGRNSAPDQVVYETSEESVILDQVENTTVPNVEESTLAPTAEEQASTEMVIPTERVGLQATDPATVQLASGQLQLIEAFAFW